MHINFVLASLVYYITQLSTKKALKENYMGVSEAFYAIIILCAY